MTTDYKVTSLFCVIDDFCKLFEAENAGHMLLEEDGVRRRRRKTSLSDSEIIPQAPTLRHKSEDGNTSYISPAISYNLWAGAPAGRCVVLSLCQKLRLSEECSSLYRAYRLRYVASNTASGLRALASDKVLRLGIVLMPKWASLRASGNIESVISRNVSNFLMTA